MQGFADFSDGLLGGAVLVALSLTLGSVVWGLAVLRAWERPAGDGLVRRCLVVLGGGALALAACQLGVLGLKMVVLSEYVGRGAFADFLGTLQCRAGLSRAALALAVAATASWVARRPQAGMRWVALALLTAALAASGAWLVHAAGRLEHRLPLMALTVLHQVGAGVWAGGLIQLGAAWRLARRDESAAALWPELVPRFSRVAAAALLLLLAPALPLAWTYVGSVDGLVGTGYGSLVVTKVFLMSAALALGGINFLAGRRRDVVALRGRVPQLIGAEVILLVALLFTAASLSSQPPPVDTGSERASLAEMAEVFRPKWPQLRTPSVETKLLATADPFAVVGFERTTEAYLWSNFSHNVAGLFLLAMSIAALVDWRARGPLARHWPLGFVLLAAFIFLRSSGSDGTWPFGETPPWQGDSEGLQHRVAALLALTLGLVEWRARAAAQPGGVVPYLFPVLGAAGGILLLTHAHTAFEAKSSYLVQVTHVAMGALAVVMATARWLELRLAAPAGRLAGATSTLAMLLIALVLLFYREANVVVPLD